MRWLLNRGRNRRVPGRSAKPRSARLALASAIGGALAVGGLLGVATSPAADGPAPGDRALSTMIEATHLPPLLTAPGEAVTLRYDVYCPPPGPDPESGAPCDAEGTAYVRRGDTGPFRPIALELDRSAAEGRYRAVVPGDVATAREGFSYYAVLRSRTTGATTTLPPSGASGPELSRPLLGAIAVSLGGHSFGATRQASARAAFARWGNGRAEVGLEPGPQSEPIGGSSFAVDATGAVSLLDETNHRVLRFGHGGPPAAVPVAVRGTMADLGVGSDGTLSVLETVGDGRANPLVRRFDANGRALGSAEVADQAVAALRVGPDGPAVLGYPDGRWLPVTERGGAPLPAAEQLRRGRPGRSLPGGEELVVEREGNEARIAEVGHSAGTAVGVRRSWRITSDTPLGEIQLAEPFGNGVLVVLRVYTDSADEFEVLALGARGISQRFSVPAAAWAETAPLARFRLAGSSLYQLGSTPDGVYVDRYDLEVNP